MVRYMEYGRTPLFYDSDILWSICALHQRFLIGVIGSKEGCVKNIKADIKNVLLWDTQAQTIW